MIWAGVIYWFSSQPVLPSPDAYVYDFLLKKSAHMLVFAVLYLLLWRSIWLYHRPTTPTLRSWFLPLLICVLYASADELHQSFVPGRFPTLRDVGFDTLGASVAMLWWYRFI